VTSVLFETLEEYKAILPVDGRLLGLDVGETTIGLACNGILLERSRARANSSCSQLSLI